MNTVFRHQMKHLEDRHHKYTAARRVSTLFSLFHLVQSRLKRSVSSPVGISPGNRNPEEAL